MKTIALFGGTGGLGSQLLPLLTDEFNVMSIGSRDVNITHPTDLTRFFQQYDVDIVINLSGYNYNCLLHKYESANFEIHNQIDVNIIGTVNILKACLPHMRRREYGRIILASSILSLHPIIGTGIYSACKSFIDSITQTTAIENASKHITCNSLRLGYFDGGMLYTIPDNVRDNIKESIPMKRWGSIEELYKTIKFLIDTEYITGQNLNISGGL